MLKYNPTHSARHSSYVELIVEKIESHVSPGLYQLEIWIKRKGNQCCLHKNFKHLSCMLLHQRSLPNTNSWSWNMVGFLNHQYSWKNTFHKLLLIYATSVKFENRQTMFCFCLNNLFFNCSFEILFYKPLRQQPGLLLFLCRSWKFHLFPKKSKTINILRNCTAKSFGNNYIWIITFS